MKRAAMSARQRAETKGMKDAEIFANKTRKFAAASNLFVASYKMQEKIMFKKSLVCRVVKEVMSLKAQIVWNHGESLSFHEANRSAAEVCCREITCFPFRLMTLEQALDFSISQYEIVGFMTSPTSCRSPDG
eukprot:764635-Hanusia_phi.AAC.8